MEQIKTFSPPNLSSIESSHEKFYCIHFINSHNLRGFEVFYNNNSLKTAFEGDKR